MATERNPFEMIAEEAPSVVPMESIENDNNTETTFEVSEDGGIIVNFDQSTEIEEEVSAEDDASLEEEFAAYLNESEIEDQSNENTIYNKINSQDEGSFVDVPEDFLKNED